MRMAWGGVGLGALLALHSYRTAEVAISVDWDFDNISDGVATGSILGSVVTLNSTNGPVNGGIAGNFTANWDTELGTNDIPDIATGLVREGAAIDWLAMQSGFVTVTIAGPGLVDPFLLFNFADGFRETLQFALPPGTISLVDHNPAGSVNLTGNLVTINPPHANTPDDGFALQLN